MIFAHLWVCLIYHTIDYNDIWLIAQVKNWLFTVFYTNPSKGLLQTADLYYNNGKILCVRCPYSLRTETGRSMIMGMATSKVRLNICGSSYVVNTSESEDYMQNLADRLNLDMNELMASSNSVSITTAAVMTALNYRDELEKASGSADNMRRQIKDYLEDAASAKMAAEEARRENASLKRRVDELERRLRRSQFPVEEE